MPGTEGMLLDWSCVMTDGTLWLKPSNQTYLEYYSLSGNEASIKGMFDLGAQVGQDSGPVKAFIGYVGSTAPPTMLQFERETGNIYSC